MSASDKDKQVTPKPLALSDDEVLELCRKVVAEHATHLIFAMRRDDGSGYDGNNLVALCQLAIREALSAIAPQEGFVTVPMEPTEEMMIAGAQEYAMTHQRVQTAESCAKDVYKAMLAAASELPAPPEGEE